MHSHDLSVYLDLLVCGAVEVHSCVLRADDQDLQVKPSCYGVLSTVVLRLLRNSQISRYLDDHPLFHA